MNNLSDIENKYKNELEKIEEWAYLRSYYRHALGYGNNVVRNINKINSFKSMFYGFPSWFKGYKYFIFSDTSGRKIVNGKLFDKGVDFIIDTLGRDKSLMIEEPNPDKHFSKNKIHTKNIVSRRLLDLLALIIEKFLFTKKYYPILDEINTINNLKINYNKQINRFDARYILHKLIFRLYKIDLVIVSCYYSRQYVLKAAHDLNIKTIEIQHGVITKNNDAYNSLIKFNKDYFPQYLLSFGENEPVALREKGVISKKIIPVGSFYLDYLTKSFIENESLNKIKKEYKITIGVSLQKGSENLVLDFITEVAKSDKNILYIIIPRFFNEEAYSGHNFPSNMIFFKSLDCYQIIMHCDYHCTFYSACAVEVPTLNVPNILLNFNNDAKKYYSDIDGKTTKIIDNTSEFLDVIYKNYFSNIDVKSNNNIYIKNSYRSNIKQLKKNGVFNNDR